MEPLVSITLPPGVVEGQRIDIEVPGRQGKVSINVPPGAAGGQTLRVRLPANARRVSEVECTCTSAAASQPYLSSTSSSPPGTPPMSTIETSGAGPHRTGSSVTPPSSGRASISSPPDCTVVLFCQVAAAFVFAWGLMIGLPFLLNGAVELGGILLAAFLLVALAAWFYAYTQRRREERAASSGASSSASL